LASQSADTKIARFKQHLHKLYLPRYEALVTVLGNKWLPYYGWRSIEVQDALYRIGRDLPGAVVTWARGGWSAHNYGCASDWAPVGIDGDIYWPHFHNAVWEQYVEACGKVGLICLKIERPHNQLPLRCSYTDVNRVREEHGMEASMAFIEERFCDVS
jgi:hypothetical protein